MMSDAGISNSYEVHYLKINIVSLPMRKINSVQDSW